MGNAAVLFFCIFIIGFNDYVLSDCAEIMKCYLGNDPTSIAQWLDMRMGCTCMSPPGTSTAHPYGISSCACPGVANKTLCCTAKMTVLFTMQPQDMSECAAGLGVMVNNMRDACSEPDVNPACVVSPTVKQCSNHINISNVIIMVVFAVLDVILIMRSSIKLGTFSYNLLPTQDNSSGHFL